MAALYHSLFTELGLALLRESIQNGTKLGITHMSFGDGNGLLPTPDATFTQMVNEVYRTPLNRLAPSNENANWLEADGVIPSAVGGFNIREVGLWAEDVMVAYANYPPTYKPSGDQGTAQIKTIRIVLQIDNTANFELKIDASVVMATIQAVEDAKLNVKKYADETKVHIIESIEDLNTLDKWDGRTVFAKSYRPGLGKGGGDFTYDSSLANENDGVSIFNGWKRDLSSGILTTHDAGLIGDGTDENPTVALQNLLNACNHGFTLIIYGQYLITQHLQIQNVDNLKIFGVNASITGDATNWNWSIDIIPAGTLVPRGMLIGFKCNFLNIRSLKVVGVGQNNKTTQKVVDAFQDGDSGIQLLACEAPIIENNDISNTFAWGILCEKSNNAIVRHNKVKDVWHQSGINCVVNSTGGTAQVYGNTVENCALYCIEFESYTVNPTSFICYDNRVSDAYMGITVTSTNHAMIGEIHDNTIKNCGEGAIWVTKTYHSLNNIKVSNNNIYNCRRGVYLSATVYNASILNNRLNGTHLEDVYKIVSPDLLILKIISSNQFLIRKYPLTVSGTNGTYYINGTTPITIASVSDSTEKLGPTDTSGDKYIVTINENVLTSNHLFKQLKRLSTNGSYSESALTSDGPCKEVYWVDNIVTSFNYGILKQSGNISDVAYVEEFINNKFIDAKFNSIYQTTVFPGVKYRNNKYSGKSPNLADDVVKGGYIDLNVGKTLSFTTSRTDPATSPPTVNFTHPAAETIIGIYLEPLAASTTGKMAIVLNGVTQVSNVTGSEAKIIRFPAVLIAGVNTISIRDTVGDLFYTGFNITFLHPFSQ